MIETRIEPHREVPGRTPEERHAGRQPWPDIGAEAECECPEFCLLDHDN